MLASDNQHWEIIPVRRAVADSIPRPRLLAKLDRRAALTIVRAPSGYGKSSLIASWLRSNETSKQILVWVHAPDASFTIEDFWLSVLARIRDAGIAVPTPTDSRSDPFATVSAVLPVVDHPVVIVLIRPDNLAHPGIDERIVQLLTRCHKLNIIVALSGMSMFPEPYLLDIDHEVIDAREFLFTAAETAQLLPLTSELSLPDDPVHITTLTDGIPALVRMAIAAIKELPDTGDRTQLLERQVMWAVDKYTREHVLDSANTLGHHDFVLRVAYARILTAEIAMLLCGPDETDFQIRQRLVTLEAAGVLSRVNSESSNTWTFPPPVRRSILQIHSRAGIDVARKLSTIARHHLKIGQHIAALEYAVEAQNWSMTADIVEHHWLTMIADNPETLQSTLRHISLDAAHMYPVVLAGRMILSLISADAEVDTLKSPPVSVRPVHTRSYRCGDGRSPCRLRSVDPAPTRRRVRKVGDTDTSIGPSQR
ncbi:hypothetical protein [Rhodococcus erythropolis]|uniref:hypothetical protein n=1 Tax=Rhodococcus erythropolis TaxID=1833 RepID=UPI0021C0870E|nr:hypothetical protein [Rhodococcus erythropolis]